MGFSLPLTTDLNQCTRPRIQVRALVPTLEECTEQHRAARAARGTAENSPVPHSESMSYDRAPSPSLDFDDIRNQFYNNEDDLLNEDAPGNNAPLVPDPSRPAAQDQHILDLIRAATDPDKQINMCSTWHPWF